MMQDQFEGAAAIALAGCFVAQETNNESLRRLARSILVKAIEELKSKTEGDS